MTHRQKQEGYQTRIVAQLKTRIIGFSLFVRGKDLNSEDPRPPTPFFFFVCVLLLSAKRKRTSACSIKNNNSKQKNKCIYNALNNDSILIMIPLKSRNFTKRRWRSYHGRFESLLLCPLSYTWRQSSAVASLCKKKREKKEKKTVHQWVDRTRVYLQESNKSSGFLQYHM